MTVLNLRRHESVRLRGAVHRVDYVTASSIVLCEPVTKVASLLTQHEAEGLYREGLLEIARARDGKLAKSRLAALESDTSEFADDELARARRLLPYVNALQALPYGSRRTQLPATIERVATETQDSNPPRWRWVYECWSTWQRSGCSLAALTPLTRKRGNRSSRLSADVRELIDQAIQEEWLREEKPTVVAAYNYMLLLVQERRKADPEVPVSRVSLTTFYRHLAKQPGFVVVAGREGVQTARRTYMCVTPGLRCDRINQRWEVDHTLGDIWVVDEATGDLLGRPWVTVIIDAYSRCIVGFKIGFEPPSWAADASALRVSILPKDWLRQEVPETRFKWLAHGVPEAIATDRGSDFMSQSFTDALLWLGIDHVALPARRPWFKSRIERFFRTLRDEHVRAHRGHIADSRSKDLKDSTAQERACVRLSTLRKSLLQWIVDVYHQEEHHGLRMAPQQRWEESAVAHHDLLRRMPHSVSQLNALLGMVFKRKPRGTGVQIMHVRYQNPRIQEILSKLGDSSVITVKLDPLDMSKAWILDPTVDGNDRWFSAQAVEPWTAHVQGLSIHAHMVILSWAKRRAADRAALTFADILASRADIQRRLRDDLALNNSRLKGKAREAYYLGISAGGDNELDEILSLSEALQRRDLAPSTIDDSDTPDLVLEDNEAGEVGTAALPPAPALGARHAQVLPSGRA